MEVVLLGGVRWMFQLAKMLLIPQAGFRAGAWHD